MRSYGGVAQRLALGVLLVLVNLVVFATVALDADGPAALIAWSGAVACGATASFGVLRLTGQAAERSQVAGSS